MRLKIVRDFILEERKNRLFIKRHILFFLYFYYRPMATAKCAGGPEQNLLQPQSYMRPKQFCEKSPRINLFITFTILITERL